MAKVHSPMIRCFAIATNTVTVNSQTAWRKGEYFWAQVKSNNTAAALWEDISVVSGGTTNTGKVLVPKPPQTFVYDADGNLVSDGLWTNVWNAENRLIASESLTNMPAAARLREAWSYLPDGRWSQRIVSSWNGSAYVPQTTNKFVWDGQVLLAVLNHTNGLELAFLRGQDLTGTMQGAGGVGGLLAVRVGPALPCGPLTNTTHFAAFDGNGNVAALVSATDGTETARYEYGPFGEAIRITGPMGKLNPIRFSTQYADDVRNVVKYLYREYVPSTGSWPNRDPIGERGGVNVYGFVGNNSINYADKLGLWSLFCNKCKKGNIRNVHPVDWALVPVINHGEPNATASAYSALESAEWFGNISGFAEIASGMAVAEVIKEVTLAATKAGIDEVKDWNWTQAMVDKVKTIQDSYGVQQGVYIDVQIAWEKCEITWTPGFQAITTRLDWVKKTHWNISSASGNTASDEGFNINDTKAIMQAVPLSVVQALQNNPY